MASQALVYWQGECSQRLDQLLQVHAQVGGTAPGRRRGLDQVNWALVLKLAAEWQAFCRNLYREATDYWLDQASKGNAVLREQLEALSTRNLRMDRGSADPASMNEDFLRLGLNLVAVLKGRRRHNQGRLSRLEDLHYARHAIAHNDPSKLRNMGDAGTVNKRHVLTWRNAADRLADEVNHAAASHLSALFKRPPPW